MNYDNQKKGWPLQLGGLLEAPPLAISSPICVVGLSIFSLLLCIGLLALGWLLVDLLSGDQKRASEATKAALPILAGVVGLPLIVWRLVILDRQTKISETKTQIDRETHYTSIFSRSIEQLGETREVKRATQTPDGPSDTTITVPNIEVRLGGIHSLARLAEESVRDREKIQNVLLAYVRENSWSDRNGAQPTPLSSNDNPAHRWAYSYREGNITAETEAALKAWEGEQTSQQKQAKAWGNSLRETRVDVNEAIDAIPKSSELANTPQLRFYECLFVGVKFGKDVLELCHFDRCTIVQCRFDHSSRYKFSGCTMIDCTFSDVSSAKIDLRRSRLQSVSIDKAANSSIDIRSTTATSLRISGIDKSTIRIMFSALYKSQLSGTETKKIHLDLPYSSLAGGRFRNLALTATSDMSDCTLANTALDFVDFSAVNLISENALARTDANPASKPPLSQERPFLWADFDPDYTEEDDIPF